MTKPTLTQFIPDLWPSWPYVQIKNYKMRDRNGLARLAVITVIGVANPTFKIAMDQGIFVVADHPLAIEWEDADLRELENAGWEVD